MNLPRLRAVGDAEQARRRDETNTRFLRVTPGLFLPAHRKLYVLSEGTAAERESAAVAVRRQLLVFLIIGAVVVIGPAFLPRDPMPAQPEPITTPVGAIQSLQLHETALSTSTTIRTSEATFHVSGAVSAKEGDGVTLKTLERPAGPEREVCVESTIKPACYQVL